MKTFSQSVVLPGLADQVFGSPHDRFFVFHRQLMVLSAAELDLIIVDRLRHIPDFLVGLEIGFLELLVFQLLQELLVIGVVDLLDLPIPTNLEEG